MHLRWPEFMAGMEPSSRSLTLALALSVFLHALALSIHFKLPEIFRDKYLSQPLDVVRRPISTAAAIPTKDGARKRRCRC